MIKQVFTKSRPAAMEKQGYGDNRRLANSQAHSASLELIAF